MSLWSRVRNEASDIWQQAEDNRRDATRAAREATKEGIAAVTDDNTAEWLSRYVSGRSTNMANTLTLGLYNVANGGIGDHSYLGQFALSLADSFTVGGLSAYEASVAPGREREEAKNETPPDIAYANDPDTSAQFQRFRKSARMLGRAGTMKYKGSGSSLGLGEQMLGDQMSLIGA